MDLDQLIEFLVVTEQVDDTFGLIDKTKEEDDEKEDEKNFFYSNFEQSTNKNKPKTKIKK